MTSQNWINLPCW